MELINQEQVAKYIKNLIEESIKDFFENDFPTYDMNKCTSSLLKWLKDDEIEVIWAPQVR